jgi:hypothetical protein
MISAQHAKAGNGAQLVRHAPRQLSGEHADDLRSDAWNRAQGRDDLDGNDPVPVLEPNAFPCDVVVHHLDFSEVVHKDFRCIPSVDELACIFLLTHVDLPGALAVYATNTRTPAQRESFGKSYIDTLVARLCRTSVDNTDSAQNSLSPLLMFHQPNSARQKPQTIIATAISASATNTPAKRSFIRINHSPFRRRDRKALFRRGESDGAVTRRSRDAGTLPGPRSGAPAAGVFARKRDGIGRTIFNTTIAILDNARGDAR